MYPKEQFYAAILGICAPWQVTEVELSEKEEEVHVTVALNSASRPIMAEGQVTELALDLSGVDIVDVSIENRLGLAYSGPDVLRVIDDVSGSVRHMDFSGAPFRLLGTPVGRYRISAMIGRDATRPVGSEEFQGYFDVTAGARTQIVLRSRALERMTAR